MVKLPVPPKKPKVIDNRVVMTMHTKEETFRFKIHLPDDVQQFFKDIFDHEFFIHVPEVGQSGVIRTCAIILITIGNEEI